MPRLPNNVPLSVSDGNGMINASLVFACVHCWETDNWGFIAYNDNGKIYQVRRCFGEWCFRPSGEESKGKWLTSKEAHEKWCEFNNGVN